MSPALFCLVTSAALLAPPGDGPLELRYNGSLEKVDRQTEAQAVKRFSLYCLMTRKDEGRQLAYFLDERGGGGWAWPERFGLKELSADLALKTPVPFRLLHEHQGTPVVITLPCPVFAAWDKLKAEATWTEGRETWTVTGTQPVMERKCWTVEASTGFGRKRTLWIDQELPVIAAIDERVFLGQGEEHTLKMQLTSQKLLPPEEAARVDKPLQALLSLQKSLNRDEAEIRPDLTPDQIAASAAAVAEIEKLSVETPFAPLATAISRDIKSQQARTGELARLASRFVGQAAPAFALSTLDQKAFETAQFKGKVVVLHFWEYQNEPLIEPYGQAGYLDHLFGKRKKLGVEVVGVAVDSRLADPATQSTAIRSTRKFQGFMNLSYPLAIDDGTTIGKFGDPRKAGAKLPLWVVLDADGKIAHYSVGYYKVNPDEGLRELDEVLIQAVRAARAKAK